jgi:hypothetical protein
MPTNPDRTPRRPSNRGQTGPRTPHGKQSSSRNSATHGCRATQHCLMPGETQGQFEAVRQRWSNEYGPTNPLDLEYLERVAEADWRRERCARQLAEVEFAILSQRPNPFDWTEEDHKLLARMQAYHRNAARQLDLARRSLDDVRRTRLREIREIETTKNLVVTQVLKGALKIPVTPEPDQPLTEEQEDGSPRQPDPAKPDRRILTS